MKNKKSYNKQNRLLQKTHECSLKEEDIKSIVGTIRESGKF